MSIIGNPNFSDKFYIINSKNSIEWVPMLTTAKMYVSDPSNKEWFGKDIYCTNENIIKGYDGKNYLKSKLPIKPKKVIQNENLKTFENQIYQYLTKTLNDLVKTNNFTSLYEILSWHNSKIKKFKDLSKKFSNYRDEIYTYADTFLENFKNTNENLNELTDISQSYHEFLKNFPKFK